ncbi:MAG: polysaccharide deacetylase [Planctomycetota bacterium]
MNDRTDKMPPGVLITFDVECSMGGAWHRDDLDPVPPRLGMMGDYGQRKLGLPLICRILGNSELAATFFVEVFNDELGWPGETEPVVQYLLDRDQDVQLHIHPNHKHYADYKKGLSTSREDDLAKLDESEQVALLEEGVERLKRWTGRAPVAFRAGNMGASVENLAQLERVGLTIDSSYSFPFSGGQCPFVTDKPFNGSRWYGNVLELALSGYRQMRLPGLKASKPLDLMGISFEECRDAIRKINRAGADAVVILHSFSLFKVRDVQYRRGRLNRDRHPVYTFDQVARGIDRGTYTARETPPCSVHTLRSVVRKAVQAANSWYWF